MRATTRRRSRLRSSQPSGDRWRPSIPAVIFAVGLLAGSFLGVRGKLFDQSTGMQEHYLLLVSDLYAQGAPLPSIRDRLVGVGYTDPPNAILTTANRLASSRDAIKQQEADQLHQFGEALVAGLDKQSVLTPIANASPSVAPTAAATETPASSVATPTVSASAAPASAPDSTPVPTAAPAASTSPNPAASAPPAPTPVPGAAAPPAPGPGKGVITTDDHKPATLRKSPTVKSIAIAALPYGSVVEILGVVPGQAVQLGNAHWYHVRVNGHEGYVYSTLVRTGG